MLKALEIAWLFITIIALAMGGFKFFTEGFENAAWFLFVSVVAVAFYFVRRKQRIAFDKAKQQNKG